MGRFTSSSFLEYLPRIVIGAVALMLLIQVVTMTMAGIAEYHWRTYRAEAEDEGIELLLPEPENPAPAESNLAGAPPFAPVRLGEDGNPVAPPMLQAEGLPLGILTDPFQAERVDFAKARQLLTAAGGNQSLESESEIAQAILRVCDELLGDRWKTVLAAEAKPEAEFCLRYWPLPWQERLPVLDLRLAAQTHALRAVALLRLKKSPEAWAEISGALRLAEALATDPSLVGYMLRTAIIRLETGCVWEGLVQGAWADTELAAMEEAFSDLSVSDNYRAVVDAERGWINRLMESLVLQNAADAKGELREWVEAREQSIPFPGSRNLQRWVIRNNQLLLNRQYDVIREHIDRVGNWQEGAKPIVWDELPESRNKHYALAAVAFVNFSRAEARLLTTEAMLRQARLAVALERYRRAHRSLPDRLEELTPAFLSEVPEDPYDGESMRYAKDAGDTFRLWSVGSDHEDDHGAADSKNEDVMTLDLVWPGLAPGR